MDVKYSYYVTTAGFKKVGGTAAQFLKADGSVDAKSYALASGTNATGSWANSSNGLENNPTLPGKTMSGSVTSSLQDANNGTIAGYLNSFGTASGNPDANWWFRIKMLHPNSAGYNGEIGVQMTGGNSLRYRKTEAGVYGGWIEAVDQVNTIIVHGKKMYNTVGNNYVDISLEAYSSTAAAPAIAFHKAGQYAGSIAMTSSNMYEFRDLPGTSRVSTGVNRSYALGGFVHENYNDPELLLTSDGGVANLDIDVINDSGSLRIQDYFEDISGGVTFYGSQHRHKLVHLVSSDSDIQLTELEPGQRIVIMNMGGDVWIEIDNTQAYYLPERCKVTLYVAGNSEYFFYDESKLNPYTP